jgi:hypothetical protein
MARGRKSGARAGDRSPADGSPEKAAAQTPPSVKQPPTTINSNSPPAKTKIPLSGKQKSNSNVFALVTAFRAAGSAAQHTREAVTDKIRRRVRSIGSYSSHGSDSEDGSVSASQHRGRAKGDPSGPGGGSSGSGSGGGSSPRMRSISPHSMHCCKCGAGLDASPKAFCTGCKNVYCERCSSCMKTVKTTEGGRAAPGNKLGLCAGCSDSQLGGASKPAAAAASSASAAAAVAHSPGPDARAAPRGGQAGGGNSNPNSNRPPPKPFAAMEFQHLDLDDISFDNTPSPVKRGKNPNSANNSYNNYNASNYSASDYSNNLSNSNNNNNNNRDNLSVSVGAQSAAELSLDDVLAGLDEFSSHHPSPAPAAEGEGEGEDAGDALCRVNDSTSSPYSYSHDRSSDSSAQDTPGSSRGGGRGGGGQRGDSDSEGPLSSPPDVPAGMLYAYRMLCVSYATVIGANAYWLVILFPLTYICAVFT